MKLTEVAPGLLFGLALALYAPRLAQPERYVFDEVYHAYTAGQYAAGNADAYVWYTKAPRKGVSYMWNHPPAGVLILSAGVRIWGDNAWGWRFMSALFGAAGIALAYALALTLTGRAWVALTAALLLLADGLYLVQARTGMLDIFGVTFMMAALLSFHRWWTRPPDQWRWLLATGLFLGLAIATKWNAAYASLLVGLASLGRACVAGRRPVEAGGTALSRSVPRILVALVGVPIAVYGLAYVPFLLTGHTIGEFVELQRQIFVYHAKLQAKHRYASSWWQWPLVLRPVWYHVTYGNGWVANIYALGNPILHWALLPATLWLTTRWARERHPGLVTLLIGFFGQWLPWALVPRISFAYHFLPAVPFGCIAVAMGLAALQARGGAWRWVAGGYVVLVLAALVYFYPVWTAIPLTREAFAQRLWLPGWR